MEKTQQIVKRPNETIGIVPNGKQRITNLIRRLYSVMLLFSQQQGEREEYSAILNDLLAAANSTGSNRTQVKEVLRDIRAIGVDWNVREGDRDVWKNVGLIEEPGLIDGRGARTIVTWKLPKMIRARLLDPRGFFTRISLEMMTRLRSGASIALYEICCQYVSNDHGKGEGGLTNRATIAEWMPRLTGSRKADYEYKFLKRDVLLTAIEEINEITDLRVELVEHKVGRKVGELQFRVFRKEVFDSSLRAVPVPVAPAEVVAPGVPGAPSAAGVPGAPVPRSVPSVPAAPAVAKGEKAESPHLLRVISLGASANVAQRLCAQYAHDPAYLLRHLDYVENRGRNVNTAPLVNKIAFLKKSLEHGYADEAASLAGFTSAIPAATVPSPEEIALEQQQLTRRAETWARFQAMTDADARDALIDQFLQQAGGTLKTFYRKNGVNNMIVKASLTNWLINEKGF